MDQIAKLNQLAVSDRPAVELTVGDMSEVLEKIPADSTSQDLKLLREKRGWPPTMSITFSPKLLAVALIAAGLAIQEVIDAMNPEKPEPPELTSGAVDQTSGVQEETSGVDAKPQDPDAKPGPGPTPEPVVDPEPIPEPEPTPEPEPEPVLDPEPAPEPEPVPEPEPTPDPVVEPEPTPEPTPEPEPVPEPEPTPKPPKKRPRL